MTSLKLFLETNTMNKLTFYTGQASAVRFDIKCGIPCKPCETANVKCLVAVKCTPARHNLDARDFEANAVSHR